MYTSWADTDLTITNVSRYSVAVVLGRDCDPDNYYALHVSSNDKIGNNINEIFMSETLKIFTNSDGSMSEEVGNFTSYHDAKLKFKDFKSVEIVPMKNSIDFVSDKHEVVFWFNRYEKLVMRIVLANDSAEVARSKMSFVRCKDLWTSLSFEGTMGECYERFLKPLKEKSLGNDNAGSSSAWRPSLFQVFIARRESDKP
nr:P20 [Carrot closterovirus 3]